MQQAASMSVGGLEVYLLPADDVRLTTATTEALQRSMPYFNSTDVKCQRSNPIKGGIFEGCMVSILKDGKAMHRSCFGTAAFLHSPLSSWALETFF